MKRIFVLIMLCGAGVSNANAYSVCGSPIIGPSGFQINISGATGDLNISSSMFKVVCITGYDDSGLPTELPSYDNICVTYSNYTLNDDTYTLNNCSVNYDASQCDSRHYYVDRDTGCMPCSAGARANDTDAYHKNGFCNYCEKEYKYVGRNNCQRCPGEQVGCMGCTYYHQVDWCMCDTGLWLDESTGECNECPCGGEMTASWPTTDPGECMLPSGGVCSDDTGVYTVTGDCYGYQM